jgi:hypothetical protein
MSCDIFQKQIFSAPYSGWVLVKNSLGTPTAGQAVNLTISGPGTLELPKGNISDALGYVNYNVIPNIGAVPQDIVVTATMAGSTANLNCRTRFVTPSWTNSNATLNAPLKIQPGRTLNFDLVAYGPSGLPAPRLPVTWSFTGPGFVMNPGTLTDSQGKVGATVLLGSADVGSVIATVTVNFGSYQTQVRREVRVETEPVAPVVAVDIFSSEQKVVAVIKNALSSDVSVKIDSKWFRFRTTSDIHVFAEPATANSHQVSVWVNGALQNVSTLAFPGFQKPTPSPTATPRATTDPGASAPSRTITCRAGSNVLSITGAAPKCPSGFKLSGQPMAGNAKVVVCRKSGYTIRMAAPLTKCPAGYRR